MKYLTTIIVILLIIVSCLFIGYVLIDNWADNLIYETLTENQDRQIGEPVNEPDNQLEVVQDEFHGY